MPPGTRTIPGFHHLPASLGSQRALRQLDILEPEASAPWVRAEEIHKLQDILPCYSTAHPQANLIQLKKKKKKRFKIMKMKNTVQVEKTF